MDELIFNELKIIKNQLTALTYAIALREAHETGIYDDDTYRDVVQKILEQLDKIVAKTY